MEFLLCYSSCLGFSFRYLTPLVFFLPHLNSLVSSCLWRLQIKKRKEAWREDIFLILTLFLGSTTILLVINSSWIQMKWLCLPDKVLKIHQLFSGLTCPLFGVFSRGWSVHLVLLILAAVTRDSCYWWESEPACC